MMIFGHRVILAEDEKRNLRNKKKRRLRISAARKKATHTREQWESLKEEFLYRCVRCSSEGMRIVKDHIIPIYQGGSDGIDNIQPLCVFCNSSKGPENYNWAIHRRTVGWPG